MYIIYDAGDGTFHYGEGIWGEEGSKAELYPSEASARLALDDVDSEEWLRHRFHIIEAIPFNTIKS